MIGLSVQLSMLWSSLFPVLCIASANVEVDVQSALAADDECLTGAACNLGLLQTKAQSESQDQESWGPQDNTSTCQVWGESHVNVFDKKTTSWSEFLLSFIVPDFLLPVPESDIIGTEIGDFWIVSSPYVQIQGRYNVPNIKKKDAKPVLRAVTIGGKFLEDNTITIGTLGRKVYFNEDEIVPKLHAVFEVEDFVKIHYSPEVPKAEDPTSLMQGLDISLPLGIRIVVNRYDSYLGFAIKMQKIPEALGGQDGQCGNFNGDNEDDTAELVQGRFDLKVEAEQLLFKTPFKAGKKLEHNATSEGWFKEQASSQHQTRKVSTPKDPQEDVGAKLVATSSQAGMTPASSSSAISKATCTVWGDPHITVFDNQVNALGFSQLSLLQNDIPPDVDTFRAGDCWLVRSEPVKIQGRYNTVDISHYKKPFLRALAIGGPFLMGNTLVIGTHSVFWNHQEILPEPGTSFQVKNLLTAKYMATPPVQDPRRTSPGISVKLPLDVSLLVNRHKNGLGIAITMPQLPGGQDGQCGNYNGERADDTAALIADRLGSKIREDELLFQHVFK